MTVRYVVDRLCSAAGTATRAEEPRRTTAPAAASPPAARGGSARRSTVARPAADSPLYRLSVRVRPARAARRRSSRSTFALVRHEP
ncbi:MAG: hypothetical protein MZW92_55550 [Comamonadaceae bacterium]|nr:hypothetical protein [Comamonadaceae bacterium]